MSKVLKIAIAVFIGSFVFGILLWLSIFGVYREHLVEADVLGNALRTGITCGVVNMTGYLIMKSITDEPEDGEDQPK